MKHKKFLYLLVTTTLILGSGLISSLYNNYSAPISSAIGSPENDELDETIINKIVWDHGYSSNICFGFTFNNPGDSEIGGGDTIDKAYYFDYSHGLFYPIAASGCETNQTMYLHFNIQASYIAGDSFVCESGDYLLLFKGFSTGTRAIKKETLIYDFTGTESSKGKQENCFTYSSRAFTEPLLDPFRVLMKQDPGYNRFACFSGTFSSCYSRNEGQDFSNVKYYDADLKKMYSVGPSGCTDSYSFYIHFDVSSSGISGSDFVAGSGDYIIFGYGTSTGLYKNGYKELVFAYDATYPGGPHFVNHAKNNEDVFISDIITYKLMAIDSESNALGIDKAHSGDPINVAGYRFTKGIGFHCNNDRIAYVDIDISNYGSSYFSAYVGDQYVSKEGHDLSMSSIKFKVYGDGNLLIETPVIRHGDDALYISVNVSNVKMLRLVQDCVDNFLGDWGIWGEARLSKNEIPAGNRTAHGVTRYLGDIKESFIASREKVYPGTTVHFNEDMAGGVLNIGGTEFATGICFHGNSENNGISEESIAFNKRNNGSIRFENTFVSYVGMQLDHPGQILGAGSAIFRIYGDGKLLAESPLLRNGDKPYLLVAHVGGCNIIKLTVDSVDGVSGDWCVWGDAKFLAGDYVTGIDHTTEKTPSSIADKPIVYLSEMNWIDSHCKFGNYVHRDETVYGENFYDRVGRKIYTKGIGLFADSLYKDGNYSSFVEVDINGFGFKEFSFGYGIATSYKNNYIYGSVKFIVFVDNNVAWTSETMTPSSQFGLKTIDVTGAKKIKIAVAGDARIEDSNCAIVNPIFTK